MSTYAETIVVVRAPLIEDRYGNAVRDWPSATRTTVRDVLVQPAAQSEDVGDRPARIDGWRLFSRPGVDVDLEATDRVEWRGRTLDVDGDVGRFYSRGRVHHVEAALRTTEG